MVLPTKKVSRHVQSSQDMSVGASNVTEGTVRIWSGARRLSIESSGYTLSYIYVEIRLKPRRGSYSAEKIQVPIDLEPVSICDQWVAEENM